MAKPEKGFPGYDAWNGSAGMLTRDETMSGGIREAKKKERSEVVTTTRWRVFPDDPIYLEQARAEGEFWGRCNFSVVSMSDDAPDWATRAGNLRLTGTADTTWLADLMSRGPFRRVAALGCSDAVHERVWIQAGASAELDVFELSEAVIRKVRGRLRRRRFGINWPERRVRFFKADLNFVCLPRNHYHVIWSCGCLHHVTNLEHLFAEVEAALQPGGFFAFSDYVGEQRLQYSPERLELVNEALSHIPVRFRRGGMERVTRPTADALSPFCAVRSDDILPLAGDRFLLRHLGLAGALFPLMLLLDLHAIERQAPELVDYLIEAEAAAARHVEPCGAYAVFQKSPGRSTE